MATAFIGSENPAVTDGDSVTLTKSGSDNLALLIGQGKVGSSAETTTTLTHNNAMTVFEDAGTGGSQREPVGGLFLAPLVAWQADGDISESANNIAVTWDSSGSVDFFGTMATFSGVDQTTPLEGFDWQGFDAGNATARSYNALDGDTIVYVYADTSSTGIVIPSGFSILVTPPNTGTNQIDEGVYCYKTLTSDENTTVIATGLSGGGSGGHHYCFVIKQVTAGGITSSGSLASQSAIMSGTAERELTSSGSLAAQSAQMSGTATLVTPTVTSSGALTSQAATMTGTSTRSLTTSGSLTSQPATMSGVGVVEKASSGALQSASATMVGTATTTPAGVTTSSGSLQAQPATMDGTAEVSKTSSGSLLSQPSTMSGIASVTGEVTSSGSLVSQSATMLGQASAGAITATGSLQAQTASMSGEASTVPNFINGTGALILGYRGQYYSGEVS